VVLSLKQAVTAKPNQLGAAASGSCELLGVSHNFNYPIDIEQKKEKGEERL